MHIVKIGMTSNEFKQYLAEEASWNVLDHANPPTGYIEVRFADGETDRGEFDIFAEPQDITDWRPCSEEQRLADEARRAEVLKYIKGMK